MTVGYWESFNVNFGSRFASIVNIGEILKG
jgi:hypothetical protein